MVFLTGGMRVSPSLAKNLLIPPFTCKNSLKFIEIPEVLGEKEQ